MRKVSYEFYRFTHLLSLVLLSCLSVYGFYYRIYIGRLEGRTKKSFVRFYMFVLGLFIISGFGLLHKLGFVKLHTIPIPILIKIGIWILFGFYPTILATLSLPRIKFYTVLFGLLLLLNIWLGVYWRYT